ncbi:MAG: DinB family protein [Bacteroidota bacterium]
MQILKDLARTQAQTVELFTLDAAKLDLTYAPGKWSVRYLLHHMADAETVLYDRIRRTISKPNQVVWGFDQDAWAAALDYDNKPLALSQAVYTACRAGIMYLAEQAYESQGSSTMVHSGDGKKTLKDVFDKVVWHNEAHLKQIERALAA